MSVSQNEPVVTFVIPCAPHHAPVLPRAVASANAQSVPCQVLTEIDEHGAGPGALRNRMLAQVGTPFVAFLDADDWLAPQFAERTLQAWRQGRYVYTDWWQDDRVVEAPDKAWCAGTWHLVTALLPSDAVRALNGFDEALAALEDTDFYVRLISKGMCGIRVREPLVHYTMGGQRSNSAYMTGEMDRLKAEIGRRYGGVAVACCGADMTINSAPVGARLDGDVLAQALWRGNREEHGRATGRRYPRMSYPRTAWVDPRDVSAAPGLWQIVPTDAPAQESLSGDFGGVGDLADAMLRSGIYYAPRTSTPRAAVGGVREKAIRVRRLAMRAYDSRSAPVFVRPRQEYPSYSDFWRLVALSGYDAIGQDELRLADAGMTYIFVTPEGIPDCTGAAARTIFWQLEYTGSYIQQPNRETCAEQWSSDPAHAARTGARYVLLGSDAGLAGDLPDGEKAYDAVMLAYMTPRRQAVKDGLRELRWPADYPGHNGEARHAALSGSRLMVHVHQNEEAAAAPLRYALAAAYRLPVVAEDIPDRGPYEGRIVFTPYEDIEAKTWASLAGNLSGDSLHHLLCEAYTFRDGVEAGVHGEWLEQPAPLGPPVVAVHTNGARIAGAMELHYGADYLHAVLASVVDFVDRFTILYTPRPNRDFGQTALPCPDSREQLMAIAEDILGRKLDWHEGDFEAGIHSGIRMNESADMVLMLDADEVPDDAILAAIERHLSAGELNEKNYGLPFLHYWRSFRHACNDGQIFPARVFVPRLGISTYPTGHIIDPGHGAGAGFVHHFGYARKLEDMRYKMAISTHRSHFRPGWWEKFLGYPTALDDLHPEIVDFWYAKEVDPELLPYVLAKHPYQDREVIA